MKNCKKTSKIPQNIKINENNKEVKKISTNQSKVIVPVSSINFLLFV